MCLRIARILLTPEYGIAANSIDLFRFFSYNGIKMWLKNLTVTPADTEAIQGVEGGNTEVTQANEAQVSRNKITADGATIRTSFKFSG